MRRASPQQLVQALAAGGLVDRCGKRAQQPPPGVDLIVAPSELAQRTGAAEQRLGRERAFRTPDEISIEQAQRTVRLAQAREQIGGGDQRDQRFLAVGEAALQRQVSIDRPAHVARAPGRVGVGEQLDRGGFRLGRLAVLHARAPWRRQRHHRRWRRIVQRWRCTRRRFDGRRFDDRRETALAARRPREAGLSRAAVSRARDRRRRRRRADRHPGRGAARRDQQHRRGGDRERRHSPSRPTARRPAAGDPVREPRDQRVVPGARPIGHIVVEGGERALRPAERANAEVRIQRAPLDHRQRLAPAAREQVVAARVGRGPHEPTSRISLSAGLAEIRSRNTCLASRRRLRIVSDGRPTAPAISSIVKPSAACSTRTSA